jgi:hypothetical protein
MAEIEPVILSYLCFFMTLCENCLLRQNGRCLELCVYQSCTGYQPVAGVEPDLPSTEPGEDISALYENPAMRIGDGSRATIADVDQSKQIWP